MESNKEIYTALKSNGKKAVLPKFLVSVANCAFMGNSHITKMNLNNIHIVGEHAFEGCRNLYSVTFSNSLLKIDRGAFKHCKQLTELNLPDSVVKIESYAFVDCGLKSIILPKNLQELGFKVFCCCRALKSVVFPDKIKEIRLSQNLFENCESLSEIEVCADCKIENGSIPEHCRIIYRTV